MKFLRSSGFHLFLTIPLLIGVVGAMMFGNPLKNPLFFGENSAALQARVYPDPNQIPDGNIPQGNLEDEFLPAFINILLALMSTVVLVILMVSGVLYIIHFGDEEQLKTAKSLMRWAAVGVLIMIIAYAVVQGLTRLTFTRA